MKRFGKLLLLGVPLLLASTGSQQDFTFRMLNLERRVDQLHNRLDSLERQQQLVGLNQSGNNAPSAQIELLAQMQRQQLALAEDLLRQQQQTFELRKALDQTMARLQELEKRQPTPESAKPITKAADQSKPAVPRKP